MGSPLNKNVPEGRSVLLSLILYQIWIFDIYSNPREPLLINYPSNIYLFFIFTWINHFPSHKATKIVYVSDLKTSQPMPKH